MMSAPYSRLRSTGIGLSPCSMASICSSFSRLQRGQLSRCPLNAVAESDHGKLSAALGRKSQDRHRVGVVQDDRARRDALHVADYFKPGRSGPERLEDPARADGVADALIDAIAHRDVVIEANVLQPGDLDRVDDVISAFQHVEPID